MIVIAKLNAMLTHHARKNKVKCRPFFAVDKTSNSPYKICGMFVA